MSKWLTSVNNLLEQLDGQVETAVVDEHVETTSRNAVDHVLSRRGLDTGDGDTSYEEYYSDDDASEYEEDEYEEEEWEEDEYYEDAEEEEIVDLEAPAPATTPSEPLFSQDSAENLAEEIDDKQSNQIDDTSEKELLAKSPTTGRDEMAAVSDVNGSDSEEVIESAQSSSQEQSSSVPGSSFDVLDMDGSQHDSRTSPKSNSEAVLVPPPPTSVQLSAPLGRDTNLKSTAPVSDQLSMSSAKQEQLRRCNLERKKAQVEARQLRKHVLTLNAQLVSLESEVKAQREELQRAAERMERDRNRHSEEREDLLDDHEEELETQKEHYEELLSEQKERNEEQLEELRERLTQVEERRMQEGGDWTKELEDALQRERESLKKFSVLQDENTTLQSKVSKLETQQSALQNKLETALQNSQTASKREREAEDKLDASLSLHSRQLSQRQAREAELERTVADLGAALVVARQKRPPPTKKASDGNESYREQLAVALEELETVKAQLALERQRSETLSHELQDVSKERTDEASAAQARQREHDRQISDLNSAISRLKVSMLDTQRAKGGDTDSGNANADGRIARLLKESEESKKAVASLSEQLLRQQKLVETSKTENLTLKNRLKTANSRADKAEEALALSANTPPLYEMDASAALSSNRLRKRVKGGNRGRAGGGSRVKSIRSALNMEPGRVGEGAEQLAATIDAVDSFMVETGAMLRHEPLARAAFFLYLVVLHVWTFCLVVFHAHSFEEEHGDFGSLSENGGIGHGPDAVVQHSYRKMEQMHLH